MDAMTNRTDLATECAEIKATTENGRVSGLRLSRVSVDKQTGKMIGKPPGDYYTLFCPEERDEKRETAALTEILTRMLPPDGKILVAGLGNENITPDSLGVKTAERVCATAQLSGQPEFKDLGMREVCVVATGVLAQTGIESAEQLKYIANGVSPDMVVVIDSLACAETNRLGKTIQLTEAGIAPGSGVRNQRTEISRETLGARVLAIGVPTVIDLASLVAEEDKNKKYTGMVVPRDIDMLVRHFAKVIARALNRALNPALTDAEMESLLF